MNKPDYPFNRAARLCPLCRWEKDEGCVVCWTCYHRHDFRNGEDAEITLLLHTAEERNKARAGVLT